jgi:hypothetical protein
LQSLKRQNLKVGITTSERGFVPKAEIRIEVFKNTLLINSYHPNK